jgi:hypothetical protein
VAGLLNRLWVEGRGELSEDKIYEYFKFQFARVVNTSKIHISVIGVKSLCSKEVWGFWDKKPLQWGEISIYQLKSLDKKQIESNLVQINDLVENEEYEKKLFYNSKLGWVNCGIYTTLFNRNSKVCVGCVFKIKCKERLKVEYEGVYKARGYELT